MALKPEAFQKCFQDWIAHAIQTDDNGPDRLIAIDGKTCRGSHDAAQRPRSAAHRQRLGQRGRDRPGPGRHRGEIQRDHGDSPAPGADRSDGRADHDRRHGLPERDRTRHRRRGWRFRDRLKDNQPKLREAIEAYFEKHLERDLEDLQYRSHETSEAGHGRIDERSYYLTKIPPDFALKKEWPWIKAIGYSLRVTQHADGSETDETRYYILSRYLSGKRFSEAVRGHWGIESMHWVLDVNFREDDSRTRERTLGNNLSWLRRFAVTLLKRHPVKDSLRGKMIRCMMNTEFLTEVLTLQRH